MAASSWCAAALVLAGTLACACGTSNPAALIPVVAFASAEDINTPDPANWSPDTPTLSVAAVLNVTVERTESKDCFESNGTRVRVHDIDVSFCMQGWPICNTSHQQGLCPHAQQDLPNGSYCASLPSNKSVYGCLAKVKQTAPTLCRLRTVD